VRTRRGARAGRGGGKWSLLALLGVDGYVVERGEGDAPRDVDIVSALGHDYQIPYRRLAPVWVDNASDALYSPHSCVYIVRDEFV